MLFELFIVLESLTENYDLLPAVKTTVICPSRSYHQIDQSDLVDTISLYQPAFNNQTLQVNDNFL